MTVNYQRSVPRTPRGSAQGRGMRERGRPSNRGLRGLANTQAVSVAVLGQTRVMVAAARLPGICSVGFGTRFLFFVHGDGPLLHPGHLPSLKANPRVCVAERGLNGHMIPNWCNDLGLLWWSLSRFGVTWSCFCPPHLQEGGGAMTKETLQEMECVLELS